MYCEKLIIADRNTQTFQPRLVELTLSEDNALDDIISNFFTEHCNGPNIAIICGAPKREILSSEAFRQTMGSKRPQQVVKCIGTGPPEDTIVANTCYCIALNDCPEGEIWTQIGTVLESIQQHLIDGEVLQQDIDQAKETLGMFKAGFVYKVPHESIFNIEHARSLTTSFNNLANFKNFPDVHFLIYLPSRTFSYFSDPKCFFPPQIEYILLIHDVLAEYKEALQKNKAAEAEKDLQVLIAKKETAFHMISSLISAITDDTNQNDADSSIINWVYENAEKHQIPINEIADALTKINPHYADFTAQTYNPKAPDHTLDPTHTDNSSISTTQEKTTLEKYDATNDAQTEATDLRFMNKDKSNTEREKDF